MAQLWELMHVHPVTLIAPAPARRPGQPAPTTVLPVQDLPCFDDNFSIAAAKEEEGADFEEGDDFEEDDDFLEDEDDDEDFLEDEDDDEDLLDDDEDEEEFEEDEP